MNIFLKNILTCLIIILLQNNNKILANNNSNGSNSSISNSNNNSNSDSTASDNRKVSSLLLDLTSDLPTKFGDEDDPLPPPIDATGDSKKLTHFNVNGFAGAANKKKTENKKKIAANDSKKLEGPEQPPPPIIATDDDEVYDDFDDEDDDIDDGDAGGVNLNHNYPDKHDDEYDDDDDDNDDDDDEFTGVNGAILDNFDGSLDSIGGPDDALPVFLVEPQSTYVVKNRPAVLVCKTKHALKLTFKCSGSGKPPPSTLEPHVDPHTGSQYLEVTATISRDLVDEYFGQKKFKCECHAWSPRGKVKSQPATIDVAYVKKQFNVAPTPLRIELGGRAEIRCNPPKGAPPPKISWLKNGVTINSDPAVLVTAEGNILVSHATLQEMANYTCVAENIAGKRVSEPALLTVYVDGGWSSWGPWTECRCPGRSAEGQRRVRTCTSPSPLHGGAPCSGANVQRTADCLSCPGGRWSAWSEWSICNTDCVQTRRRTCFDTSSPSVGARLANDGIERGSCNGRDYQSNDCSGGNCKLGKEGYDWILYLALALAAILCILIGAYLMTRARKSRRFPPYSMTRAEMQPESFHDPDKKIIHFQPDITQGVVGVNYEYPTHHRQMGGVGNIIGMVSGGGGVGVGGGGSLITASCNKPSGMPRSISEHHYDIPHLQTNYATPLDRVSGNESYSSSNYSRRVHSTESLATTTNTSDSTYDVATEPPTLPMSNKSYMKLNTTRQIMTSNGGCLKLYHSLITLMIPESSLSKNTKQSIFLSLLNDDVMRLRLPDKSTHVSPVVNCGPIDTTLVKPVILKIPHCAENLNQWHVSLYRTDSHIHDIDPKWEKVISVGEETIHTPCYIQLDNNFCYIMTEQLGRYVLIGESINGGLGAVKRLKLCLFGPSVQPTAECSIRVYVIEDYPSAIEHCVLVEKRLGGVLLQASAPLYYHDNGNDLNVNMKCIGGWRSKLGTENQKIPFSHVWNNSLSLHCSFAIERTEQEIPGVRIEITARQRNGSDVTLNHVAPYLPHEKNLTNAMDEYQENSSSNSAKSATTIDKNRISSIVNSNSSSNYNNNNNNNNLNTSCNSSDSDVVFRLTSSCRKELCHCLDPPTTKGNDWRMLAQKLCVDRYIVYFATKNSPTDHILDLWESRNRDQNSILELIGMLKLMGRQDAVQIVEKQLGPSWL